MKANYFDSEGVSHGVKDVPDYLAKLPARARVLAIVGLFMQSDEMDLGKVTFSGTTIEIGDERCRDRIAIAGGWLRI